MYKASGFERPIEVVANYALIVAVSVTGLWYHLNVKKPLENGGTAYAFAS